MTEPERGEVFDGLVEGVAQLVPGGREPGQAERPGVERLAYACPLRAEPELDELGTFDFARERDGDVHPHIPRAVRREFDRKADDAAVTVPVPREQDLRPAAAPLGFLEEHATLPPIEAGGGEWRPIRCVERMAECEVVLLDADDVREVRLEVQLEGEEEGGARHVAHDDVVLQPLAHEAMARDREDVLLERSDGRVARVEGCREVLDRARGEQKRPTALHRERERRQKARVVRVEAVDASRDVAEVVADAEGRAFEDRQCHRVTEIPFA